MRRITLPFVAILLWQILAFALAKSVDEIKASTPKLAKDSMDGISSTPSSPIGENILITHEFPFTDKRMRTNQVKHERTINQFIIEDLDASESVTNASKKYPQDSPAYLVIETKYAYHLYIDDTGITMYTFSYDLSLNSCGVNVLNLRQLGLQQKKGDIFSQNLASATRRDLLNIMLKDASEKIKNVESQEVALLITVHPIITLLPAAIIEDTLEDLRLDFPSLNVRYCKDCPNILSYDEYAYLTWLTTSNTDSIEDDHFFEAKDEYVINLGLQSKAVFAAYPLTLAAQKIEDDKLVPHSFCIDKQRRVNVFIQNAYYERSLDKFTSDFVSRTIAEAADKHDSASDVTVKFPCYPKYYKEKIDTFSMVGTGDLKLCRTSIVGKMNQNYFSTKNNNFQLPNHDMPWPLHSLEETDALAQAKIYIESDAIEDLYAKESSSEQFQAFSIEKLEAKINEHCTEFLSEEVASLRHDENQKEFLNKCIHLIYINAMLSKIKIPRTKILNLKLRNNRVEDWLRGVTIRNLEQFHSLEKEWFYAVQDRALETYLLKVKETQQVEKDRSVKMTIGLVAALAFTFWIGFIVRFSTTKEVVVEGEKNKYK